MPEPHEVLAAMTRAEAARALGRCCGAGRWVEGMLACAPFASTAALLAAADQTWEGLTAEDHLEAFAHHPRIGADLPPARPLGAPGAPVDPPGAPAGGQAAAGPDLGATAAWARAEQASAIDADADTRDRLRRGNLAYDARFGYTFIVCATGKSAGAMLALLEARLLNPPDTERRVAAREQAQITRLRLLKLATP
jgi:2-oxo-4-hydroxy-4-carboxy-5-ureidoimidazoline decarboxylase